MAEAKITVEELNNNFTALLATVDAYYNGFDDNNVRDQVIKSIVDWQNEYYGQAPETIDIDRWAYVFRTATALVDMGIKPTAKAEPLPVATKPGKVIQGETIFVKGYVDPMSINKFPIGKDPYFTILAGFCVVIPTTLWLYVRSKKKRRQLQYSTL